MHSSNEMAIAHEDGKTRALASLCEEAFIKAAEGKRYSYQALNHKKVFVTFEGERQLYAIARNDEELTDVVETATVQNLVVDIVDSVVYNETFEHQTIADESESRISEIVNSWKQYPGKASESSALKLILAYFNAASVMVNLGVTLRVNKFASVDWDDVATMRTSIEDSVVSPGAKIIRDRVKDLSTMFGSPKNLREYKMALARYAFDVKNGRAKEDCYTVGCSWSPSKVQWKDERVLLNLLLSNLGKEYVEVLGKKDEETGHQAKFLTCITPQELSELIGLKLALGIRHQAVDVEEVSNMEANLRRLASWLQKRCNKPEMGGTLHPSEVVKQPKDRISNEVWDRGTYRVTDLPTRNGVKSFLGCLNMAETWVEDKILVARRLDIVARLEDRTLVTFTDVYDYKVASNVRVLPMPELPAKDWDMWVSAKAPSMFPDRRLMPDAEGNFPMTYVGPTLVHLEQKKDGVLPVKAGKCEMHDGRLWYQWKEAGSKGDCPECNHTHIMKTWIREDHWAPKLHVENKWEDEEGEFTTSCTCLASKDSMRLVERPSVTGKTTKETLEFDDGVYMGLLVPEFRRYIERCLWSATYVAPPILEESYKRGELRGEHLKRKEELERDIALLEENNDPSVFELYEELEKLEAIRKGFDIRKCVLHVFIPMNPSLFRVSKLPAGYQKMGIRCQVSGLRSHLLRIVKENSGYHQYSEYTEASNGQWIMKNQVWK